MSKAFYTVDLGQVILKFSSLRDADKVCLAKPKIKVEGKRKHDRVTFKVRLSDNILNHVLLLSRINFTCGFPLELAKGVSLDKLAKMNSSGLKKEWWFLSASILASEVNDLEELLEAVNELEAFIHEGVKLNKIRLALTEEWYNKLAKVYPDASTWDKRLIELKRNLNKEALQLLKSSIKECYDTFYAKYWKEREKELLKLSMELKKVVDILQPLKQLERITKIKFIHDVLEVFLVDVFRVGGGIYGVPPNRIVHVTGVCAPLFVHLTVAHEAGHLLMLMSDWRVKLAEDVISLAEEINVKRPLSLTYLIEEHVAALLQLKVDEYYYEERRTTHGFMGNEIFKLAEKVWERSKEELGASWDLLKYMRELLEEIKRNEVVAKELVKLLKMECGLNNSNLTCFISV